ncbi:hypothetical protein ACJJIG_18095 [Microbulbifer sp. SSSA007]|uniref:hypothetical protein n=1 Tax=Microbulbifer sp. SSSA007 TaxID=3243379 RepID=UPI00403A22BD
MLKCTIAAIDDQNNVQTDGAGDLMFSIYVATKTLKADAGQPVYVADHVAGRVFDCIVEVWLCIVLLQLWLSERVIKSIVLLGIRLAN